MPEHLTNESGYGLWRTPTAHDWKNTGNCSQLYLSDQVRPKQIKNPKKPEVFPTPHAGLWKTAKISDVAWDKRIADERQRDLAMAICPGTNGGALNPTWVEWLMGWPIEWTDSKPSGTDKYQQWCALHGIPFTNG
jgi:hypothetical protein